MIHGKVDALEWVAAWPDGRLTEMSIWIDDCRSGLIVRENRQGFRVGFEMD